MWTYTFYVWPFPMELDNLTIGQGWASIVRQDGQFVGLSPSSAPDWRGVYRHPWVEASLLAAIEDGTARVLKHTEFDNVGLQPTDYCAGNRWTDGPLTGA